MRAEKKVFLLTSLGVVSQISSIMMGMILVRYYSSRDYGTFRQATFLTDTVSYICMLALPASLLYLVPPVSSGTRKGIFVQTQTLLTCFGTLATGGLFLLAGPISRQFHNPDLKVILHFFCLYPLFFLGIQHIPAWFMSLNRYVTATLVQTLGTLSGFAITILPAAMGFNLRQLLEIIVAFMAIQAVVQSLWCYYDLRSIKTEWSPPLLRKQMNYSLPLGLSGIVWYLSKEIDKYCVAAILNPTEFAFYAVGALEIPFFSSFTTAINSVLVPKIAQHHHEGETAEIPGVWREVIRRSIMVLIPGTALLFAVSVPMIGFLYTRRYLAAVVIFQIYLLRIPLRIFNPSMILQGIGKTKPLLFFNGIFLLANTGLILLALKVLHFGLWGPAAASVLSTALTTAISIVATQRFLGVRFLQIFPLDYFLKVFCVAAAAAAAGYFGRLVVHPFLAQGIIAGTIFCLLFLPVSLQWGLVTVAELKEYIPKLKRKNRSI